MEDSFKVSSGDASLETEDKDVSLFLLYMLRTQQLRVRWQRHVRIYGTVTSLFLTGDANQNEYIQTGEWPFRNGTSIVNYNYLLSIDPSGLMIHALFDEYLNKLVSLTKFAETLKKHPECWQFQFVHDSSLVAVTLVASLPHWQVVRRQLVAEVRRLEAEAVAEAAAEKEAAAAALLSFSTDSKSFPTSSTRAPR